MTRLKIDVTAQDIRRGQRHKDPHNFRSRTCPIAQAIQRTTKRPARAAWHALYVNDAYYPTPRRVVSFMRRADEGLPLKPFTFTLLLPATLQLPTGTV